MSELLLTGNHKFLNFYPSIIILPHPFGKDYGMDVYSDVETRFQAMKSLYVLRSSALPLAAYNYITSAESPYEAKSHGRQYQIDTGLWDRSSFGHMVEAQTAKFTQHRNLAEALLDTGDAAIIEHRKDKLWGDNMDGTGMNLCGRSLEIVRDVLKELYRNR